MERQKLFEYVYNKPLFPMRETTEIKEVPLDSNDQDVEQEEEIRITRPTQVKTKRKLDKKTIEEKQKMITLLLNRAEAKYTLGKFKDCFTDCLHAEKLAREIRSEARILSQAVLGKGKAKFKLGDVKEAHALIQESLQLWHTSDAQNIMKEVEKMAYFESLLDFSLTNPLYPQFQMNDQNDKTASMLTSFQDNYQHVNNMYHSTVRSPMNIPKLITQYKYMSDERDSWQQKFVQYSKRTQLLTTVKVKS